MKVLGNILWLLLGGLLITIDYFLTGIILCITIVGIPFGTQLIKLSSFTFHPFGREAVIKNPSTNGSTLNTVMNVIWILLGGIWNAVAHIVFGLICFITIIGIPFGKQHFKLAGVALSPFGRKIVKTNNNNTSAS